MRYFDSRAREREYQITIGGSLIASQLIFILLFTFWPHFERSEPVFEEYTARDIQLDMIDITQQPRQSPPPPPTPYLSVATPEDLIEDDEPDLEDLSQLNQWDFREFDIPAVDEDQYAVHNSPERPPNVTRIVEPVFPSEARRANVRVQIMVSFLVDTEGLVEEISISEIRLYDDEGDKYEIVEAIGYGLIDATLNAAIKWQFRPAEDQGEYVRAITRHMFTYGV